jgi:polysaccharide export outer membrane protein
MPTVPSDTPKLVDAQQPGGAALRNPSASLRDLFVVLYLRRRFIAAVCGSLLMTCLLYCLIAPNQYEASARVALRTAPGTALHLDGSDPAASGALASGQVQLETLAGMLRGEQLAWNVIADERLYLAPAFLGRFGRKFPGLNPHAPTPEAQAYLLDRFERRLTVRSLPRTMILQIRFRSGDAALSAAVVNDLIRAYRQRETEVRVEGTEEATEWLNGQLTVLKAQVERDDARLVAFQEKHGLVSTPETLANGQPSDVEHASQLTEIDALGRELVSATSDRLQREAEYREALQGDPEAVVAADPTLQTGTYNFSTGLLQQLRARRSDLEQERAQLSIEHGPNFPRVLEVRQQLKDVDQQMQVERDKLLERFKAAWKTAEAREQLVRRSLDEGTHEGMKLNDAAIRYAVMRQEADASHQLYIRMMEKAEEAGLTAGIQSSNVDVVDVARQPAKPVSPDPLLDSAITLFVSLWLAVGGALLLELIHPSATRVALLVAIMLTAAVGSRAQAPTPSTSGLPTGVENLPQSTERRSRPDAREAPPSWNTTGGSNQGSAQLAGPPGPETMPAPIASGDVLQVSESHTAEFRSTVRVSGAGSVTLPMIGGVNVAGLDEQGAARAIETALVTNGMLLHPQVTVLVLSYVGQDVSVLGEVMHPGVYPYAVHHRLLDLISAASGLTQGAGSLVTILHRDNSQPPQAVVLDASAAGASADHNPELEPGDTVEVNRAGLVYVVGDVIRPGGFPVDPSRRLTVVQAITLAWGPTQNAALTKAVLIREQKNGRTLTVLNLKRLLRGQDPDLPIEDHDIIFVPDSAAKNLWNRTMESVVQSAAGVSIYAGLVYSQRF